MVVVEVRRRTQRHVRGPSHRFAPFGRAIYVLKEHIGDAGAAPDDQIRSIQIELAAYELSILQREPVQPASVRSRATGRFLYVDRRDLSQPTGSRILVNSLKILPRVNLRQRQDTLCPSGHIVPCLPPTPAPKEIPQVPITTARIVYFLQQENDSRPRRFVRLTAYGAIGHEVLRCVSETALPRFEQRVFASIEAAHGSLVTFRNRELSFFGQPKCLTVASVGVARAIRSPPSAYRSVR